MLQPLTGDPIQVIAPFCHGGAINEYIKYLEIGSSIISYSDAKDPAPDIMQTIAHEPLCESCSSAEKFVKFIHKAGVTTTFCQATINFVHDDNQNCA